jgi:hypothetical protein
MAQAINRLSSGGYEVVPFLLGLPGSHFADAEPEFNPIYYALQSFGIFMSFMETASMGRLVL